MSMLNLAEIVQAEGDLAEAERLRRLAMESRNRKRKNVIGDL
jgi:hypothetical protein